MLLPDADGAGAALLVQDGRGHCSSQQVSGGGAAAVELQTKVHTKVRKSRRTFSVIGKSSFNLRLKL